MLDDMSYGHGLDQIKARDEAILCIATVSVVAYKKKTERM
jgi:hypothetical protein